MGKVRFISLFVNPTRQKLNGQPLLLTAWRARLLAVGQTRCLSWRGGTGQQAGRQDSKHAAAAGRRGSAQPLLLTACRARLQAAGQTRCCRWQTVQANKKSRATFSMSPCSTCSLVPSFFSAYSLSDVCLPAKQVRRASIWWQGFLLKILAGQIQLFKVDLL